MQEIEKKDYLLKEQGKELKDLYKEIEKLVDELGEQERHIKEANFEIERLHSIIKEVREYIENENIDVCTIRYNDIQDVKQELLEILDKVEENK